MCGDTASFGCGITRRGRHRTEVTEAHRRGIGIGGTKGTKGRNFCRLLSAWVRESREKRKASHEGHGENELNSNSVTDVLTCSTARPPERRTPNAELSFDAHGFIAIAFPPPYLVRWLSGRKRRFAKALYPKRVPRVRIPASPVFFPRKGLQNLIGTYHGYSRVRSFSFAT